VASSNLIRVQHLKELVESQGFPQAIKALRKWRQKTASKALRLFLEDPRTHRIEQTMKQSMIVHPKLQFLIDEIQAALTADLTNESKIIIFSNFRDTVRFLDEELNKIDIKVGIFLGHASTKGDKGLSQKEQLHVLEEFKNGDIQVLVSTSVGEEGLDVGNCDLVVFYDSVPSVVRAIQRRGRGRKKQSQVIHLVTKKTRDEAMYWAIKQKDKSMKMFLREELPQLLEKTLALEQQPTLDTFFTEESEKSSLLEADEGPLIIVDSRETRGQIPKLLKREGARIRQERLEVGDYLLSDRVVVELKTHSDFIRSVYDGRLFQPSTPGQESQLIRLSQQKVPLLVVQLESEGIIPYSSLNSIMGALSSIILDFRIPIIFTQSPSETTALLLQLAKREQYDKSEGISLPSAGKKTHNVKEVQLFLLSTIPGVNYTKAKNLLEKFPSIQAISSAEMKDLISVPQIGKKLAKRIQIILNSPEDHEIP
jgi:Fanconi anemia group M protein